MMMQFFYRIAWLACFASSGWITLALADSGVSIESSQQQAPSLPSYILGPDDQLTIRALDAEEISDKPFRIESDGTINLPMVGRLKVAGLSIEQFEAELKKRLEPFIRHPEVAVSVTEYRTQTVSVIGSVKNPGAHEIRNQMRLLEVLSLAGGLQDDAGINARITRRREYGPIPLPGATVDPTGEFNIADINLVTLISAKSPENNIQILPNDVVSVPKAQMIYVIGDVRKAGGLVLNKRESITVLEAISLAEGLEKTAKPQQARILRPTPGEPKRSELPVNLKKMLAGQANDVALKADDILFIPGSKTTSKLLQTLQTATQIGVGIAIIGGL